MIEPCLDCDGKRVDEWGYLCDIYCGKRSRWLNYERGRKEALQEVVGWVEEQLSPSMSNNVRTGWRRQIRKWGIE